jgi:hypothetical protein
VAKLVIVAPYYEPVTQLWNPFLKGWVKRELEKRNIGTILLWAGDAVKQKLFEAVKDPEACGVLGAAHGWEKGIVGQNDEVLIQVGDQIGSEWRKLCLNLVSCLVGKELVPWLVQQGVPCAVGEVTEYWFTAEDKPRDGDDPEEDQLLKYYLYAEYTFWFRMAEGCTAGDAYKLMLREYDRQSRLAAQVDEETAYWLSVDRANRKFFGDPGFALPIPGVRTRVELNITAVRDPRYGRDIVTASGRVTAEDGSVPKGQVEVWVNDLGYTVPLDDQGGFAHTFTFYWGKNEERLYHASAIYPGWSNATRYLPSYADAEALVEPKTLATRLEILEVKTERSGPQVHFDIRGRLLDEEGYPVPGKLVSAHLGDGLIYELTALTDKDGLFRAEGEKSYPPLQTQATLTAVFKGDDVYRPSEAMATASFPPNWEFIAIIGALALLGAAVLLLLLLGLL